MSDVVIFPGSTIGIIGGGQLGRMTAVAAMRLGYKTHIYCPDKKSPAFEVATTFTCADYQDEGALLAFAKACQVITFEFENIPKKSIELIEKHSLVHPNSQLLFLSQNRLREKKYFRSLDIATVDFKEVTSVASLKSAVRSFGGKGILKTCELGYDGKGQYQVDESSDLAAVWQAFSQDLGILEAFAPFSKEVSVIVARSNLGAIKSFPVGENYHQDGILRTTNVPATVDDQVQTRATLIAEKIASKADLVGLLAVEFFVLENNQLLVNEMAPRPHNSGHWTQDGCFTDQFEQLVRAICGLPFGSTKIKAKTKMKNLIGDEAKIEKIIDLLQDASLHLYGKDEVRPGRKMGHINFLE